MGCSEDLFQAPGERALELPLAGVPHMLLVVISLRILAGHIFEPDINLSAQNIEADHHLLLKSNGF